MNDFDKALHSCRCCDPSQPSPAIHNSPGLDAIAYRIGIYGTILHRMLLRLPRQFFEFEKEDPVNPGTYLLQRIHPLAVLTTRDPDDPSIALSDAWAVVGDVLTFYQERIANESWLRTAKERRSLLELARAIGYELSPGVSASSFLAFTVETAPGSPAEVTVPAGTRVQSIPGQDELPQTFETSAELSAAAAWNRLLPRRTRPQELAIHGERLLLLGLSSRFPDGPGVESFHQAGFSGLHVLHPLMDLSSAPDPLTAVEVEVLYLAGVGHNLAAGDRLLLAGRNPEGSMATLVKPIHAVSEEIESDRTRIDLREQAKAPAFVVPALQAATIAAGPVAFTGSGVASLIQKQTWSEHQLTAFVALKGWNFHSLIQQTAAPPPLPPPETGVFLFRQRAATFGHNAPRWQSLPLSQRFPAHSEEEPVPYPTSWDGSDEPSINQRSDKSVHGQAHFFAERVVPKVVPNSWLLLEGGGGGKAFRVASTTEASLADFSLSAKATGFTLRGPNEGDAAPSLTGFKMRSTTLHAESVAVGLADLPIEDPLEEATGETTSDGLPVMGGVDRLMLDRLTPGLGVGRPVIIRGRRVDAPAVTATEAALVSEIFHEGGFTTLLFETRLKHRYLRDTVEVLANVVEATHGETVREVLGSGDAAKRHQSFQLNKPPLTHVPSADPSGAASTLEVRVQGARWEEVRSLYLADGDSEVYTLRRDDDGNTRIFFGDGRRGRRLPTGPENITARYRSGIGLDGQVAAGSLSLLQTRPPGIREVTNPLAASGAGAPATRDEARMRAPLTVRTLDRIVSLADYEDFAAGFGGIGKTQAAAFWDGEEQAVLLTVAGEDGLEIEPADPLARKLREAIEAARDPARRVRIAGHELVLFEVAAGLRCDPRLEPEAVLATARQSLAETFCFARRNFGQPVSKAEVVTALQRTFGVEAVRIDALHFVTDQPSLSVSLPVEVARFQDGIVQKAQLLLINPAGIRLEEGF